MRFEKVSPGGRRWRLDSFLAVLMTALLLRLVWVLAVPVHPVSDSLAYNLLAQNLAKGIGYCFVPGHPTAYWPVGTSFVYSIFYRIFGVTYAPILVFNLALSLGTIWLSMILARKWFNRTAAIMTGYILAVWPLQIEFTSVLASELIFNFIIVAWLVIWELPDLHPRLPIWIKAIVIGLLAAAACYIRPVALLLPGLLCALKILRERKYLRPIASTVAVYVLMAVLIAPWSIRNTRAFGHFIQISTNSGANLWMGNHPGGSGETQDIPDNATNMQEGDRDLYLGGIAKNYIRQYPGQFVVRTLRKAVLLHNRESIGVYWNLPGLVSVFGERILTPLKILSDLYWWAVLLLALIGAVLVVLGEGVWMAITSTPIILWAYFTALYAVYVVQDRYHFASTPFIGMLAALTLVSIAQRVASPDKVEAVAISS